MATREQIYSALFALGQGLTWGAPSTTWAFSMRRTILDQLSPEQQPAFLQTEFSEESAQVRGQDPLRKFHVGWFIMLYDGNPDAIMATQANQILDAIDALFPPDPMVQTLGGLVYSVKINGAIDRFGGSIDSQMLLVVPLTIIAP